jgi:exopolyphosphatase/guanosine-5'-triphosphate,3'-diphosphate pyrophosphatase
MTTDTVARVAALDCGTNSTRLLIVNRDGSTFSRQMRITRLGQGVDSSRRLAADAIDRTVAVLVEYRRLMSEAGVTAARLVTTSAARDAENGEAFLRRASGVIGVRAELLSGQAEGELACAGATAGLPDFIGDDVVVDIGGGSTELAVRRRGQVSAVSLDIGCVRVTERCLLHDPPLDTEVDAAESLVDSTLRDGMKRLLATLPVDSRFIGLAGSVTTLAALELALERYEPERIHHTRLTRGAVDKWCKVLMSESTLERARRTVIVPGREDVIHGGALILHRVMDAFGLQECIVSERDMLDGLAMSLLGP